MYYSPQQPALDAFNGYLWLLAVILAISVTIERKLHVSILLRIKIGIQFLIVLLWWYFRGFCLYRLADLMECRFGFVSKPANLIGRRYILFHCRHLRRMRQKRQHNFNYGPKGISDHTA